MFLPFRCSSPGCSSARCWPILCKLVKASCWLLVCFSWHCDGAWSQRHITEQVHYCCNVEGYFLVLFPFSSFADGPVFSSLMPAVNNLTSELLEAEKSNRRLERELRALRKRLGATLVLRSNLQEWEHGCREWLSRVDITRSHSPGLSHTVWRHMPTFSHTLTVLHL